MSTTLHDTEETMADLLRRLGDIPPDRILMRPLPGTATPRDALLLSEREPKQLCELVDGVLVRKAMGHQESRLAARLIQWLLNYLDENDLGVLAGADGPHRLDEDQVRFPDVSFIAWDRIPEGANRATPMPDWIPNLVVEVLSPSNTRGEMRRKLNDYFTAGVELVWIIDPATRTITIHHTPDDSRTLTESDTLTGDPVLPGFTASVAKLFEQGTRLR